MSKELGLNLHIPLAASYNTRAFASGSSLTGGSVDQRKVNSFYETITNAETGKKTLYLSKRQGCGDASFARFTNAYTQFVSASGTPFTGGCVGALDGSNNVYVYDGTPLTLIYSYISGANWPSFLGVTAISNVVTAVLQVSRTTIADDILAYFSSAAGTWTKISDAVFTALHHRGKIEHLDGFAFQLAKDNAIYNSDINTLVTWPAQGFIKKQSLQDSAKGLAKLGSTLLAFGKETVEGYQNTGNPTGSPLSRVLSISARIGLADFAVFGGMTYAAELNGKLYFVGRTVAQVASIGFYAFDGQKFEKASSVAVDRILAANTIYSVVSFPFYGQQAVAVGMDLPGATTQRWLMFFPEHNEWFEWDSTGVQPMNDGQYFVGIAGAVTGIFASGSLGSITPSYVDAPNSGGTPQPFTMTHQFRLAEDAERKFMPIYGVVGDTVSSSQNLGVSFSDDDSTFGPVSNIDMTRQRKLNFRGGSYYKRTVKLTHTGTNPCRLTEFVARVE